jgi:hypothetical protein
MKSTWYDDVEHGVVARRSLQLERSKSGDAEIERE